MRFVAYAVLAVSIAFVPMQAHASGTVMGGFNCAPQLPCDQSNALFSQSQQLVTAYDVCVSRNMSIPTVKFFDEIAGLDSNGCLTTNQEAFTSLGQLRATPQCCIKPIPEGGCAMHCDMISQ